MKSRPPARRTVIALALLATALVVATAGGRSAQSATPPGWSMPEAPTFDQDGNGLFEDLEARLSKLSDDSKVDVLVQLDSSATASRVADLSSRLGGFATGERFGIVNAFAAKMTKKQAELLAGMPSVAHVELDGEVHALNDSAQASLGVTKARVDAPALDGDGDGNPTVYSPSDLVAAVIDTGIDASHQDLDEGKVIAWKDYVNNRATPYDDNGHGSHVSGTIAGDGDARSDHLYHGVAPAAGLVGIKVLNSAGSGSFSSVISALDWIVTNKATYGIEAANLSLGADGCNNGTDLTSQAIQRAVNAGVVVAVAAGNAGPGTCTVGTPGAAPAALTVGAMTDLGPGGFYLASFSSRGLTADGRIKPDIVAPGVSVTSVAANSTNGYSIYSGTSMATPFVAGVVLLMRDANPSLTPQQVKDAMTSTAEDWGPSGADGDYGAGRLDAYAALRAAGAPLGTTGPAVPAHTFRSGSLSGTGASADITLNVTDTQWPIAATLIESSVTGATSSTPNFSLTLLGPTGSTVASSSSSSRQKSVSYRPTATGNYVLRVSSPSGSGPYFVDIAAGTGPAGPPPPPPPSAPGAPTLDSATAGPSNIVLAWTAPSSNGGSAITGYKIYRGVSSGGETLFATTGTGTNWTDTNATPGTTYYYKVSAVNGVGEGALSNERSATVATAPTAPGAPNLTAATAGVSSVALTWNAPSSNGGSSITGYKVYRGTGGAKTPVATLGTVTSWTDTATTPGATYSYTVSAVNAVNEGAQSNERSATLPTAPAAPTLNAPTPGNGLVTLSWSTPANGGSALTGFKVYRGTSSGNRTLLATLGTVTSYSDNAVTNGTAYYYSVSATNAVGDSAQSNERSATPNVPADATAPSKPTGINLLVAGTNQIAIDWAASTDNVGVTGYEVYRESVLVATVTTTYFLDSGLSPNTIYSYQVRAIDAAGNRSTASNALSPRTASQTAITKGILSGVAFDASGQGNRDAVATFTPSSGSTKSDNANNKGVWSISNLNAGAGTLTISAPGRTTQTFTVTVVAGKTVLAYATLS